MLASLLIANRGEIARRIIRTARRMGIRTVAVYSDADVAMPFVREADQARRLGAAAAADSYLDGAKILAAAQASGAEAVHPGYGFLSENVAFAEGVERAGLIWVGAPPNAIRAMGLKDAAKKLMQDAGVPVTPGYLGEDQSLANLQREADRIGFPVLIKAVAGGGGKGMRRVDHSVEFGSALESCRREAKSAFGDDRVILERYVTQPRHIEVQVFGDSHGNWVHLFERDCSMQRRHQKVIEEAPAPGMDSATRARLTEVALMAAKAVNYVGAGTIEFIADASEGLRADRIWFMEMNTRLQVEHPVTEMITGEDLVEWQLRVACGERLPKTQQQLGIDGWAMEARLYAESPASGFLPSTGPLTHLRMPRGIRVDSGVEEGDVITPYYDPMIAKLIVHGRTRREAAAQLARAAAEVQVWPVKTNAGLLARAATDPDFLEGRVDTGFIERHAARVIPPTEPTGEAIAAAAAALLPKGNQNPWTALQGFRVAGSLDPRVVVEIQGGVHLVQPCAGGAACAIGDATVLFYYGDAWVYGEPTSKVGGKAGPDSGGLLAPMPGAVTLVDVARGQSVKRGQRLLVLEAMKMEYVMVAPFDGVVVELSVKAGMRVSEGALLARIEALAGGS